MNKVLRNVLTYILLAACAFLCYYVYATVPTKPITDLFRGKVSQAEIQDGYYEDFLGRMGDDDVPLLSAQALNADWDTLPDLFNVETQNIISLDFYELKDSSNTSYSTRSGYRGRVRNVIHLDNQTTQPFWMFDHLYAGYYLVELDDGTYISAYLHQDYANATTLPLAALRYAPRDWEDHLLSAAEEHPTLTIHTDRILYMLPDEVTFMDEWGDFLVRIVLGGGLGIGMIVLPIVLEGRKKRRNASSKGA